MRFYGHWFGILAALRSLNAVTKTLSFWSLRASNPRLIGSAAVAVASKKQEIQNIYTYMPICHMPISRCAHIRISIVIYWGTDSAIPETLKPSRDTYLLIGTIYIYIYKKMYINAYLPYAHMPISYEHVYLVRDGLCNFGRL